jgi:hypothetical protein
MRARQSLEAVGQRPRSDVVTPRASFPGSQGTPCWKDVRAQNLRGMRFFPAELMAGGALLFLMASVLSNGSNFAREHSDAAPKADRHCAALRTREPRCHHRAFASVGVVLTSCLSGTHRVARVRFVANGREHSSCRCTHRSAALCNGGACADRRSLGTTGGRYLSSRGRYQGGRRSPRKCCLASPNLLCGDLAAAKRGHTTLDGVP